MLIYLLATIVGLSIIHFYIRLRRKGRLAQLVPGPAPLPFVGNLFSFGFDIFDRIKVWKIKKDIIDKYYPITRVWIVSEAVYSLRHPDDLEILLKSTRVIDKAWMYDYLKPWLNRGLFLSTDEKWTQRRKLLTPTFHFNVISKYMEVVNEQGEHMVQFIENQGTETTHEIELLCLKYTLSIICEAAMGVKLDTMDEKTIQGYQKACSTITEYALYRLIRFYIKDWCFKLMPFLKIHKEFKQALETAHNFTNKIIEERKEYHRQTNYKYLQNFTDDNGDSNNNVYTERKKRLAMLDLLLLHHKNGLIDDEGMKEEVATFNFGGHDTIGVAMTFILILLAENKEIQEKAREEVTEVLDACGGKLEITEIQKLQYLERCVKESLRLYPPGATIFRYIKEDLQLKNCLVPGGSTVVCHFFDLHRDPNFWTDPERFDPDRFLPERSVGRHPFAYLPFSAGPRNCIGQKFAMYELKALIGRILYNFTVEPVDRLESMDVLTDMIIRPAKPFHLKFIKIHKS